MRRQLAGSVVVITGASSGLGKATALAFATEGADVVVAARTEDELADVAARCREVGVRAEFVPTDVGKASEVAHLAEVAVSTFGRIDTWVNAAAVLVAGPLGSETTAEIDRLIDTNIRGSMFGARAALAQFEKQAEGGVLIEVASLLGLLPNPLVPTYVMSKFALRGLSLSLHHQVAGRPGTRVCMVLPGPIDTPMFERAANHTGRRLRAIAPAMSTDRVAASVVSCARRPRRQVVIGFTGHALLLCHRLIPRATEWAVARAAALLLVQGDRAEGSEGALFTGQADGRISGGWRRGRLRRQWGDQWGQRRSGAA